MAFNTFKSHWQVQYHLPRNALAMAYYFIRLIIVIGGVGIILLINNSFQQADIFSVDRNVATTIIDKHDNLTLTSSDSKEVEQISRVFPIWIENRLANNNNSRPYDWCVPEDIATNNNNESQKGLLFVKVHKCSSSTGAGVTLRIRDGLSKRLMHVSVKHCFAHYDHAEARELGFQKRDRSESFLWSIVREPAQRTLSHFFYFQVSRNNVTATEESILSALKGRLTTKFLRHNFQSSYLDLPNQHVKSRVDRIINGYDFLAVSERLDESLVVLAMLAQVPLSDMVVFSSKVSGGYSFARKKHEGCVKVAKKWTTPKIDEYIQGSYRSDNADDYLLYNAAQRSLDKTIESLGRKRVEENVKLLKNLQQQNQDQCASEVVMPCPQPAGELEKLEHERRYNESCYASDFGCGHACTDRALADYTEKEWANLMSG